MATDRHSLEQDEQDRSFYAKFYSQEPPDISDSTRQLLINYSGIPAEAVAQHCYDIREKAFKIFPYPCIGQWRFLALSLGLSPHYAEVLRRVIAGEKIADVGCCFAQDIRRLAADGAPHDNLYAIDLRQEFFDLGYELFRDQNRLKAHFIATDFFEPGKSLDSIKGKASIVHAASFLHLFDYQKQILAAKGLVGLLNGKPNCMIVGRQVAQKEAGVIQRSGQRGDVYRHNGPSFRQFWNEVGKQTGHRFDTEVQVAEQWAGENAKEPNTLRMTFCVKLIE